ncbi:GNAT family N-acetyltransferase [Pseudomonas sp. NFXW11]|uniref:GNAT family N-acetyltransferase n=1 Tax=Pseudomonas sp. NFXW11 TaxID=2819531 RepID=UPI003CEDAAE5
MSSLQISLLADSARPLLNKFYRQHQSPMRAASAGQLWVIRESEIVAGMSLTVVAHGHWLTGLLVAPEHRGRGLARQLLERARQQVEGPVWLFCHPHLQAFYQRLGFSLDPDLPQPLAERLLRYQRSKPLLAMVCGCERQAC